MKLYIDGPADGGEGAYWLLTEAGEVLNQHYCSNVSFAQFDLVGRRRAKQQEWHERFGEYQVIHLGDDEMTRAELGRRNHEWATAMPAELEPLDADVAGEGEGSR